jgi:PTH1 family peptidyl-tRNA hydrolase
VARRLAVTTWKNKDGAAQAHVAARAVVLVKPQSYMNDSGIPLARISHWWKTPAGDLLVVVDDLDLPLGRLRMRASGGSGGHNGLKSIIEHFGTEFSRLRAGIGRSSDEAIDHVLSPFTRDEESVLDAVVGIAADGVLLWLERGAVDAMNFINAWRPPGEDKTAKNGQEQQT